MRRDWIMTDVEREEKRKKIEENRRRKLVNPNDYDPQLGRNYMLNRLGDDNDTSNYSSCNLPDSNYLDISNQEEENGYSIKLPIRRRRRRQRNSSVDKKTCPIRDIPESGEKMNKKIINEDIKPIKEIISLPQTSGKLLPPVLDSFNQFSKRIGGGSNQNICSYNGTDNSNSLRFETAQSEQYHAVADHKKSSSENKCEEVVPYKLFQKIFAPNAAKPVEVNAENAELDRQARHKKKRKRKEPDASPQPKYNFHNQHFKKNIIKAFETSQLGPPICISPCESSNSSVCSSSSPDHNSAQNSMIYKLTEPQKKTIEFISNAYKEAIQLVKAQGLPKLSEDINTTINLTELAVRRIINYFKLIPEFAELKHDLMINLLKSNMMSMLQIHGVNSYNKIDDSFREPDTDDTPYLANSLEAVYGRDIYQLSVGITRNLYDVANSDTTHIKLLMLIVLFDPLNRSLSPAEIQHVTKIQNKYVTLLYSFLSDMLGLHRADLAFKTIIFEMNRINELSKWFKTTIDEKSNADIIRPLMIEIFSIQNPYLEHDWTGSQLTSVSSNKSSNYDSNYESSSTFSTYLSSVSSQSSVQSHKQAAPPF